MILLDVNVLVEAGHRDAARHSRTAGWLATALAGPRPVGLADAVLVGAMRVLTHRKVFADPASPSSALAFLDAVRTAPAAVPVPAGPATWRAFAGLVQADGGVRGNLVPDGWLAALALSHGAVLVTRDRGFRRFTGLRVEVPGD
ncbi:MAG TPA: TA system VapC family ribonuclease toxin [Mycobacteriales bacterium]|nr:TA system VapC family ribonuclease toxin [Mycobacteriales bacterium]